MIKTDVTITWETPYSALLSWDGGATLSYWTVCVNGVVVITFQDLGTIEQRVSLDESLNHVVTVVQHDATTDDLTPPDDSKLLRPTVRWLSVDNAARYEIREVADDGTEYILHMEEMTNDDAALVHSWRIPAALAVEGVGVLRVKVYATGSFGECEAPSLVSGFIAGHPPKAATITANESSTGIELLLSPG